MKVCSSFSFLISFGNLFHSFAPIAFIVVKPDLFFLLDRWKDIFEFLVLYGCVEEVFVKIFLKACGRRLL